MTGEEALELVISVAEWGENAEEGLEQADVLIRTLLMTISVPNMTLIGNRPQRYAIYGARSLFYSSPARRCASMSTEILIYQHPTGFTPKGLSRRAPK
jgi:hypothetical protein